MKTLGFLTLLLYSSWSYAWTCPETDNSSDIATHWSVATDVFWGRVISGRYTAEKDPYANNVEFKFQIFDTFKGAKSGTVALETSHEILFSGVEIGGNYIVFLYGNKVIDHCGILINVAHQIEDKKRLRKFYSRQRDYKKEVIDYVLNQATAKP